MGLRDQFKKFKKFITPGSLDVKLSIPGPCHLRQPFDVEVSVSVVGKDFQSDRIYLKVQFREEVTVTGSAYSKSGNHKSETFHESSVLFEEIFEIDDARILLSESVYDYTTKVDLPYEVFPAFQGKNAKFIWRMRAYVSKRGIDSKSKWLEFNPLYKIT